MARKYHVMAAHTQIFLMYVVSGRCFRFAISLCYSEVITLESAEVGENSPTVGHNLQIFAFENVGDTDGAPSDLRYKITSHSDILAKVPRGGVLHPRRLQREKINNKSQE